MELFHVALPVVYGSRGCSLVTLPCSRAGLKPFHLCTKGGRPLGSNARSLLKRGEIAICSGCNNASLHQAGFFSSSHRTSRNFLALTVGGTRLDSLGAPKH